MDIALSREVINKYFAEKASQLNTEVPFEFVEGTQIVWPEFEANIDALLTATKTTVVWDSNDAVSIKENQNG